MSNDERVPFDVNQVVHESGWFDLWHTHVDWSGEGNESPRMRNHCLKELFALFDKILSRVENWTKPRQTWIVVDALDSSQDAVYLHTGNPNKDNFPYEFEGVAWGGPPPVWLLEFVSDDQHEFGVCQFDGNLTYWVREKRAQQNAEPDLPITVFEMDACSRQPG